MPALQERRGTVRFEKNLRVFCVSGDKRVNGESFNVSEKGLGFYTDLPLKTGDAIDLQIYPQDEFLSINARGEVRNVLESSAGAAYKYKVGLEFCEGLKDFSADQLIGCKDEIKVQTSAVINASQRDCYDAICNFESYPSWQKTVRSAKVLDYTPDSRPAIVEFTFDFILKKAQIINHYEYSDRDYVLSWMTISGDIEAHEGAYVFQKLREDRVNAVISGSLVAGFYVPQKVMDYLATVTLRNSVRSLKKVVESGVLKSGR